MTTFYHATTAAALPGIAADGIAPSKELSDWPDDIARWARGKAFGTINFEGAVDYGKSIWARQELHVFRPIIRFEADHATLTQDPKSPQDFYSRAPIKANFDVFFPGEGTSFGDDEEAPELATGAWKPLTIELARQIAQGDFDGEYIEPEEISLPIPAHSAIGRQVTPTIHP